MDYNPPFSSVHGILQIRILEWVTIPFSRRSSQPKDWISVSHITGKIFIAWATRGSLLFFLPKAPEKVITESCAWSLSRVRLFATPMDFSLPDFSAQGASPARMLGWVAMPSSRGSSQPKDWTQVSYIAGEFFTVWATYPSYFAVL